jgi:uncharacterized protein (DUF433 family)
LPSPALHPPPHRSQGSRRLSLALAIRGPQCDHFLMIDWSTCPAVEPDPERLSGAWVFGGTRAPVAAPYENLEDGAQVAEFLPWFPGVSLEQARAVLEHAAQSALVSA